MLISSASLGRIYFKKVLKSKNKCINKTVKWAGLLIRSKGQLFQHPDFGSGQPRTSKKSSSRIQG